MQQQRSLSHQGGSGEVEYRKPNFSDREKLFLIEQVRHQHQTLLRANGRTRLGLRKNSWQEICRAVNAFSPHVRRTVREVNKKWRNLAFTARREAANFRSAKQPVNKKISDTNLLILDILQAEDQAGGHLPPDENGLERDSDSDSVIFEDEIEFEEENSSGGGGGEALIYHQELGCQGLEGANQSFVKQSPPSSPSLQCQFSLDPSVVPCSDRHATAPDFQTAQPEATLNPWTIQSVESLREDPPEAKRLRPEVMIPGDVPPAVPAAGTTEFFLAFERERLKVERERLDLERERFQLERDRVKLKEQKMALEKLRLGLLRGDTTLPGKEQPLGTTERTQGGNGLLIQGGKVVNHDDMFLADVLVQDGIIKDVGVNLPVPTGARIINAKGKLVIPGGIDPHTHLQAVFMGAQTVDDFLTGTKAALVGGTTMIIDFAQENSLYPLDVIAKYRAMADPQVCCDYGLHLIISKWNDRVKREMTTVANQQGVNSFKMFMAYKDVLMLKDDEMLECFETCAKLGALAMVHCENGDVIAKNEKKILGLGITGPEGHLFSRPEDVEAEATHRAIVLAEHVACPVYIVHVMSKSAADIITLKKQQGCVVFGEPIAAGLATDGSHYFDRCWRHAACHILSPPLRNDPSTPGYLMDKLNCGDLECTGTDHCCFSSQQKALGSKDFTKIPNGINGVQERMAVVWEKGVVSGKMSPSRFVAVTSTNAAKVFNIYPKKGRIQAGSDADIVVWDPDRKQTVSTKTQISKSDFNIFDGLALHGVALYVLSRGTLVVHDGQVTVTPGSGRFVPMAPFCDYVYDRVKLRAKAIAPKKVERETL